MNAMLENGMVVGAAADYESRFIPEADLQAEIDAQFDGIGDTHQTLIDLLEDDVVRAFLATLVNPNSSEKDAGRAARQLRSRAGEIVRRNAEGKF